MVEMMMSDGEAHSSEAKFLIDFCFECEIPIDDLKKNDWDALVAR
jgi:hypothetical protein